MFDFLQDIAIQKFIDDNIGADLRALAMKKSPFLSVPMKTLITQIDGKRTAKEKLPAWFKTKGIIYPHPISMEQCSSELTACYKSSLCEGKKLIDMTGGFGVDSWAFSKKNNEITYCEKHSELSLIAQHNFQMLESDNITVYQGDAVDFLRDKKQIFDFIYIDPARRDMSNKRTFTLSNSEPNVTLLLPELLLYTNQIMIKTSPLLDIDFAISVLKNIAAIHIVAIKNEVKELLFLIKKQNEIALKVSTVNFLQDGSVQTFSCLKEEIKKTEACFSMPKDFLYEPNVAIMKSGAFNLVTERFNIHKLHKNSHLYTSDQYITDFPGKIFHILDVLPYKPIKTIEKANIVTRNFPDTSAEVQQKMKIKNGGNTFLFCTTLLNCKPSVLVCRKINELI